MKPFTDNAGRTWNLCVNVTVLKRIKDLAGVDILNGEDRSLLERLSVDPVLLCDVVYAAIKPEADNLGVTEEDFGKGMYGDPIEAATDAFLDELANFIPNQRRREVFQQSLALTKKAHEMRIGKAQEILASPQMQQEMEKAINSMEIFGDKSTNLQELSE